MRRLAIEYLTSIIIRTRLRRADLVSIQTMLRLLKRHFRRVFYLDKLKQEIFIEWRLSSKALSIAMLTTINFLLLDFELVIWLFDCPHNESFDAAHKAPKFQTLELLKFP